MVDTFVQIHRVCTTKVNPNVGYGFWVIMMCQCIFISCSKYTTLMGILIVGKTVHMGGQCWASGGSGNKESSGNAVNLGSIPGLGRSPGEGNNNQLQYSCLENSMDRGTSWATVHGVARVRQGIWEIPVCSCQCCSEPETALRKNSLTIQNNNNNSNDILNIFK